jgi:ribosomal protein S12 methylthiotransferase
LKYHIVTLGCPKNEVDSEGIDVLLMEAGHSPAEECRDADLVIVNTCGFIDAAREESLASLRTLAAEKRPGSYLVAAGCLAQRDGSALVGEVAGIDAVIGCRNWPDITSLVGALSSRHNGFHDETPVFLSSELQLGAVKRKPRPGSAYVKISDGCGASCAFCAIPSIKGPYQSKAREAVLDEVRQLADGGASEVVLVGQDTTAYGLDRGEKDGLATLLRDVAEAAPRLRWVRVLYLYPQRMTPYLLKTMAELPQVCKYVDIPLQHTHPAVLRRMKRPADDVARLVDTIREAIPEVAIRTTFMVGFPGETAAEHSHLLRSIERLKLDRIGVFTYSPQRGTPAASMPDQVPPHTSQRRWREAMEVSQKVSLRQNKRLLGRELEVLVEGSEVAVDGHEPMNAGRSYRDAPEVDGLVLFPGPAALGEIVRVRITGALEYDLVGETVTG